LTIDDPTDPAVRLASAVAVIERDFRSRITLGDLARAAHLSQYHFHRLFRRRYGKTPKRMIEELRIAEVQRLLLAHASFRDAARLSGFYHQSHMTSRFRRLVGVAPRRWLNEVRTFHPILLGPAAAASAARHEHDDGPSSLPEAPIVQRSLRILVVEDDPDGLDILVRLLSGAGHQVEAAADAASAMAPAADRRPAVLLSDIALPGMDGCELMRTLNVRYRLPGIALTALPGDRHDARCRAAGFAQFISKPAKLGEVLDAIATLTPSRSTSEYGG
jgi:CheY-like chemotaxis protein/AraC-like DNA-binding protein